MRTPQFTGHMFPTYHEIEGSTPSPRRLSAARRVEREGPGPCGLTNGSTDNWLLETFSVWRLQERRRESE